MEDLRITQRDLEPLATVLLGSAGVYLYTGGSSPYWDPEHTIEPQNFVNDEYPVQ